MKILALFVLVAAVAAKHEVYNGWKSYYVGPPTADQLTKLGPIFQQYEVDPLSDPILQREGLVLVQPQHVDGFEKTLENEGIAFKLHTSDFKATLDKEDTVNARRKLESLTRNAGKSIPFDAYQDFYAIDAYMLDIAERYPETVTLVTAANSFEGRPIRYLKISSTNFEDTSKPVIFIDGGIHSREWISPPTVLWSIHKLVEDNDEPDLLELFDWILMPVVNPDGYQFSFDNYRFWRKTRSTDQNSLSFLCPGVDGNRNYDFFWNTVGTSSFACADDYGGGSAFSEIETRVVRDIIHEHLFRMALYLTIHSYGSMLLYPWGHDGTLSYNAFALHTVGTTMVDAIHQHKLPNFPNYVVGNAALVIGYATSGAAEDYAHFVGVPLSYTYELPGLSGGFDGFHLDPIYIEQICRETWAGFVAGARRAGELFNP